MNMYMSVVGACVRACVRACVLSHSVWDPSCFIIKACITFTCQPKFVLVKADTTLTFVVHIFRSAVTQGLDHRIWINHKKK